MNKTFNLLFFVKKSKIKANGTAPIYLRITIDGKAKEISSKRNIFPKDWDSKLQKVTGQTIEVKALNSYLKTLEQEVYAAHHYLIKDNSDVSSNSIKSKVLKLEDKARMLIPIFKDHNKRIGELVKIGDYAPGTLERYETSLKHTIDFISWNYNEKDIDIRKIDNVFIADYEFYLRTERSCANNTAVKYIKNFKKIIRLCLANGWIDKDPFINYEAKLIEVERDFLLEEELDTIYNKQFSITRLKQVRDIYIFSCFTGLAYVDVKKLKNENISI